MEDTRPSISVKDQTMCGRFELIDPERVYARFAIRNAGPLVLPNVDVRPTQLIPVVTEDHKLACVSAPVWRSNNWS
jgi:putative SOS response-associated peptidase YedK